MKYVYRGEVETIGFSKVRNEIQIIDKPVPYINWFNPADPDESYIKTIYDKTPIKITTYDDGVSYVSELEAEANFILAMDAIETDSYSEIMKIKEYVQRRLKLCKFFLPLKKRKEFFNAVHEKLKTFYFKQQRNRVLLALDKGLTIQQIKNLKKEIYNLKLPLPMKKELWEECDKDIRCKTILEKMVG